MNIDPKQMCKDLAAGLNQCCVDAGLDPSDVIRQLGAAYEAGLAKVKTCSTCAHKGEDMYCTSEKITADDWKERRSDEERADMLIYGQFEEGGFRAGDNFGCVHHKEKEDQR